jgi:glutamine synthetase
MTERISKLIKEERFDQVAMLFSDTEGYLRANYIMPEELIDQNHISWVDGISIEGSSIPGFQNTKEAEWMLIRPDLSRPFNLEWTQDSADGKTLAFLCNIVDYPYDSRTIAQQTSQISENLGFIPYAGPTLSFGLGKEEPTGSYTPPSQDNTLQFRNRLTRMLIRMGIAIESHCGENSNIANIDLVPNHLLTTADNIAMAKLAALSLGKKMGVEVSFSGQAMHAHLSLWKNGYNCFFDPSDQYELSQVGKCFIEQLLSNYETIRKTTNPKDYQNDYKVRWSTERDDSVVLVPMYFNEKKKKDRVGWSKRCVYRNIYSDANPYLALSALFLGGLEKKPSVHSLYLLESIQKLVQLADGIARQQ